jgi:hypothetical protein
MNVNVQSLRELIGSSRQEIDAVGDNKGFNGSGLDYEDFDG